MLKTHKVVGVIGVLALLLITTSTTFAHGRSQKSRVRTPVVAPVVTAVTTTASWGAYSGNTDSTMAQFEAMVGKPVLTNAMFWGWDEVFPQTQTGAQGKTLLLFWEPAFGYDQINNGSKDAYIAQFAQGAKAYGYPVMLSPFDEFNLNEAAWGNTIGSNTPESFKAAWRRVHDIFVAQGATNVTFALAYNNMSIPSAPYSDFYPGDAYVDYVGVDGFNFGSQTFREVFDTALNEAKTFGKPVWILSTGSVSNQPQFLYDLGQTGLPWVWFNQAPFNVSAEAVPAFSSII